MNLGRKITLYDLSLISASAERGNIIKTTKQFLLVRYKISYANNIFNAEVREYPNLKVVTKMSLSNQKEEVLCKMLDHLRSVQEVENKKIHAALREDIPLDAAMNMIITQSNIFTRLSLSRIFGRFCAILLIASFFLIYKFGVLPFVFLTLAGIDGIILSFIWKKKILCD